MAPSTRRSSRQMSANNPTHTTRPRRHRTSKSDSNPYASSAARQARTAIAPGASARQKRKTVATNLPEDADQITEDVPKCYLESLPDEILLRILSLVPGYPFQKRKAYYNMSLTSRRLNRTANNFLYEWFNGRLSPGRSARFLKTLFANPELARFVKNITWQLNTPISHSIVTAAPPQPTSADCRALRESLKALGVTDRSAWVKDFSSGQSPDLLRLAMLHAQNLHTLCIEDDTPNSYYAQFYPSRIDYTPKIITMLTNGLTDRPLYAQRFEHLRILRLRLAGMTLEQIYPVLRLPMLEELLLQEVHTCPITFDKIETDTRFSSVSRLIILHSFIASSSLAILMNACRSLTHLHFVYTATAHAWGTHTHQVNYTTLYNALKQHKDTLCLFDFDDNANREPNTVFYPRGRFSSFKEFPELTTLAAPFEAFPERALDPEGDDSGSDSDINNLSIHEDIEVNFPLLLPPALERLALTVFEEEQHTDRCSDSLYDLSLSVEKDFPDLEEIIVRVHRSVDIRGVDFYSPKWSFRNQNVCFDVLQEGIAESDMIHTEDEEDYGSPDSQELEEPSHPVFEFNETALIHALAAQPAVMDALEQLLAQQSTVPEAGATTADGPNGNAAADQ
ncbi:hypothetical protein BU24DRAFT_404317 [Aaosphaeria arxii CBS 175.79]|uniref:Uncharacterized protein n=1 Tax=Aaosphaeria arxii CBS 175.79 TaxID=1450172 RepID=A0A6A5Y8Z8_9PLEO|nr:uncharacterized protein BU24DRAFT_404317 [Aaosphaeria arxii CBS 175.79]KAF2021290.1 hypothetical protein BU24DRAFT_404317 [Aaosphaeria arxii CBS 175.79]